MQLHNIDENMAEIVARCDYLMQIEQNYELTFYQTQQQQQQHNDHCSDGMFMEIINGSCCRHKNGLCVGTCRNFVNTGCDDYAYDFSANTISSSRTNMKNGNNTVKNPP